MIFQPVCQVVAGTSAHDKSHPPQVWFFLSCITSTDLFLTGILKPPRLTPQYGERWVTSVSAKGFPGIRYRHADTGNPPAPEGQSAGRMDGISASGASPSKTETSPMLLIGKMHSPADIADRVNKIPVTSILLSCLPQLSLPAHSSRAIRAAVSVFSSLIFLRQRCRM